MYTRIALFTALAACLLAFSAQGQNVLWQTNYDFNLSENAMTEMVVTGPNTIFLAGTMVSDVTIDGTVYEKQFHPTQSEVLLLAIDSSGSVQWASQLASEGNMRATGLAVDEFGDVYLSVANNNLGPFAVDGDTIGNFNGRRVLRYTAGGALEGTVAVLPFDNFNASRTMYVEDGRLYYTTRWDLYCYDLESGSMLWTRGLGGSGTRRISGLYLDGDKIYIGGQSPSTGGVVSLGDTSVAAPSGSPNIFMARLDTSGAVDWLKSYGTGNPGGLVSAVTGIEEGPDGNFLFSGYHSAEIVFDNIILSALGTANRKAHIMQISPEGEGLDAITAPPSPGSHNFSMSQVRVFGDGTLSWAAATVSSAAPVSIFGNTYAADQGNGFMARLTPELEFISAQPLKCIYNYFVMRTDGDDKLYFASKASNVNSAGTAKLGCMPPFEEPKNYFAAARNEDLPFAEAEFSTVQRNHQVLFRSHTDPDISTTWAFGDGNTAATYNAVHAYDAPGAYEACLTAVNACGENPNCVDIQVAGLGSIRPQRHVNVGYCTAVITGGDLDENMEVSLTGIGAEIPGEFITLKRPGEWAVNFNLDGVPLGMRDLHITTEEGDEYSLEDAFEVTEDAAENVGITFTGSLLGRVGAARPDALTLTNDGGGTARGMLVVTDNTLSSSNFQNFEEAVAEEGDLLAAAETYAAEQGIGIQPQLFNIEDEDNEAQLTAYILPAVPGGITLFLPSLNIETVAGPFLKSWEVFPAIVSPVSSADEVLGNADLCMAKFFKRAVEGALDTEFDGAAFAACFQPVEDELADLLWQRSLSGDESFLPFGKIALGVYARLAESECLPTLPDLTDEQAMLFVRRLSANYFYLNDVEDMECENLPSLMQANSNVKETPHEPGIRGDFCDIASDWAGSGSAFMGAGGVGSVCSGGAHDPNAKFGPGFDQFHYYVNNLKHHGYSIGFENVDTATAAAQTVIIIDTLDLSSFDAESFRFTGVQVADTLFIEPFQQDYAFYDVRDLSPAHPNFLLTTGELDPETGIVVWTFQTLDQETLAPTAEPFEGFLPPNQDGTEGVGFVFFSVDWRDDLVQGALVENDAHIFFDFNEVIITDLQVSGYDTVPPVSEVNPLPATTTETLFPVTWGGFDEDAGIRNYEVYVSENDGPWTLWQVTDEEIAAFEGTEGSTYAFYCKATDWATNAEEKEPVIEAETMVTSLSVSDEEDRTTRVFPNPTDGELFVITDLAGPTPWRLTDLGGKTVLSGTLQEKGNLDLRSAAPGFYLLEIGVDADRVTRKIIRTGSR